MTANSTPRQGLMDPVDSDLFEAEDFAATFGKLDAVPGTTIVANYAGLAALGWGAAQYGSKAIQLDNVAEWIWTSTGWKRTNSLGELSYTVQPAPVSTTVQTSGGGPTFITSGNFIAPGLRSIRVHLNLAIQNSASPYGIVIITVYDNGTLLDEWNFRAGTQINNNGTNFHAFSYLRSVSPQSTHNISVKMRSAVTAAVGGGGTSVAQGSRLMIEEM